MTTETKLESLYQSALERVGNLAGVSGKAEYLVDFAGSKKSAKALHLIIARLDRLKLELEKEMDTLGQQIERAIKDERP